MNGLEDSVPPPHDTGTPSPTRSKRRFILAALLLAPLLFIVFWECGHYARFGDFFTYGYHVDLVLDHSDIGAPEIRAFHCLRVTNYTFHTLKFEAIQLPPGITDSEILYHDGAEKWDEQSHSWSKVYDSADDPSWNQPNITKRVTFGRSIYPTACTAIQGLKGIKEKDTVRLVAFTSYSKSPSAPCQLAFYSPAFTVQESSRNTQKSDSGRVAGP